MISESRLPDQYDQHHGLAQHQAQHIEALRTQRHAYSNFPRPPGYRVRHHPVKTDARQQ